jgi:hypothetical protein
VTSFWFLDGAFWVLGFGGDMLYFGVDRLWKSCRYSLRRSLQRFACAVGDVFVQGLPIIVPTIADLVDMDFPFPAVRMKRTGLEVTFN